MQPGRHRRGNLSRRGVPGPQLSSVGSLAMMRGSDFGSVEGVAMDPVSGRIFLTETTNHRLWVVTPVDPGDAMTWTIAPLAGSAGLEGHADGAPLAAAFRSPSGLAVDVDARVLYVADTGNHVIRALSIDGGGGATSVTTVAGVPESLGNSGDGGPASAARFYRPQAVAVGPLGDLFVSDTDNNRVRRIDPLGTVTTVLGTGTASSSGEGVPAAVYPVDHPLALACDAHGNVYVTSRNTVRMIVADGTGIVDGTGEVQTIYGGPPRDAPPESITSCLTGLAVVDDQTLQVTDQCTGALVEIWRQPLP